MKHFTARLPEELIVKIKIRAANERSAIQDIILRACESYLRTPMKRREGEDR